MIFNSKNKKNKGNKPNHVLEYLLSEEEFLNIVEFERARSHRTGDRFCIVVFYSDTNIHNDDILTPLALFLKKRVRSIDRIGWFDKKKVGVILPDTSPQGAQKFGDHICQSLSKSDLPLFCTIYPFPSDWLVGSKDEKTTDRIHEEIEPFGDSPPQAQTNFDDGTSPPYKGLPLWKRCVDIIGSLLALALLSPIFLLSAIYIKIVSPGPVFFKQQRVGYGGKPFVFWKFRSMHHGRSDRSHREYLAKLISSSSADDSSGPAMTKIDDDPRIIPLGSFLRKTCIDELPQLFNVLRGEMSLVGPRPPIPYEVSEYLKWHNGRFDAVPGMTGLWQVSGKNSLSFKEMVRLDIRYAREFSFWIDLLILCKTPLVIIRQIRGRSKVERLPLKGVS